MNENQSAERLTFIEIWNAALELPQDARAVLVDLLQYSLDDSEETEISDAWMEEIEHRTRDIDEGRVKLIPGEEVLARLRSRFKDEPSGDSCDRHKLREIRK